MDSMDTFGKGVIHLESGKLQQWIADILRARSLLSHPVSSAAQAELDNCENEGDEDKAAEEDALDGSEANEIEDFYGMRGCIQLVDGRLIVEIERNKMNAVPVERELDIDEEVENTTHQENTTEVDYQ
ncbi:hypothetical protein WOLCODRAFT_151862 [Wolfiporia cocos MD-104 SS10]|uniref:Uncharacterized protein n=1 Tax=Wolfiporia cocos (strain MD-104) TaxID=742152 RepID=A0A2H3JJT4_WOLCO|nr:hypothetical protein WOLCODRAFT_151862 [Wolfiporia cocos MD-104 SS10]